MNALHERPQVPDPIDIRGHNTLNLNSSREFDRKYAEVLR